MKKEDYPKIEKEIDRIANEKKVNISKLSDELDRFFNNLAREESK